MSRWQQDAEAGRQGGHLHGRQRRGHTFPGRDADVDGPRPDFPEDVQFGYAPEFDADVRPFGEKIDNAGSRT